MSERSFKLPVHFVSPAELSGRPPKTPILVAYSGGADSTALLHMLCSLSKETEAVIYAAHVNHGIRGNEADRDEAFCRLTAERLGVRFFVHHADVPALAKQSGESIEATARRIRYEFFDKIMKEYEIPLLAVAHNANDNLETILFHLARGSGLKGLCGIPVSRLCAHGTLVRPLLGVCREDILSYCRENSLDFVTDSTNVDTDYTRNRIRSEIVPLLQSINPSAVAHGARLAESLRADELCLESMAEWFFSEMRDGFALEIEKLNGSPEAIVNRALMMLYEDFSGGKVLERSHLTALRTLSRKGIPHSSVTLPHGAEAVIEDGRLCFRERIVPSCYEPYVLALSGQEQPLSEGDHVISQTNCEIVIRTSHNAKNIYKKSILLSIDSATINGHVFVRNRRPEDKIRLGGMHKSLKKLLCDRKVPLSLRPRLPIICDGDGILAVPLVGVREGAQPTVQTPAERILYFYVSFDPKLSED